jgi:hypothetical protein
MTAFVHTRNYDVPGPPRVKAPFSLRREMMNVAEALE